MDFNRLLNAKMTEVDIKLKQAALGQPMTGAVAGASRIWWRSSGCGFLCLLGGSKADNRRGAAGTVRYGASQRGERFATGHRNSADALAVSTGVVGGDIAFRLSVVFLGLADLLTDLPADLRSRAEHALSRSTGQPPADPGISGCIVGPGAWSELVIVPVSADRRD